MKTGDEGKVSLVAESDLSVKSVTPQTRALSRDDEDSSLALGMTSAYCTTLSFAVAEPA